MLRKEFRMQVDVIPIDEDPNAPAPLGKPAGELPAGAGTPPGTPPGAPPPGAPPAGIPPKEKPKMEGDVGGAEGGEMSSLVAALQNMQDTLMNIDSRLVNLEAGGPVDTVPTATEDLTGQPENPKGKKVEQPLNPAEPPVPKAGEPNPNPIPKGQVQVTTGDAPGDENNDVSKTKTGDDGGAAGKVPQPSIQYPKPKVTTNQIEDEEDEEDEEDDGKKEETVDDKETEGEDLAGKVTDGTPEDPNKPKPGLEAPANPDPMKQHEQFINKELARFTKEIKKQDRFVEKVDLDPLTTRQSVVGVSRSESNKKEERELLDGRQNEYLGTKETVNSIIKEYLSKPGVTDVVTRRKFGLM